MKCKVCGSRVDDGMQKCPVCGSSVGMSENKSVQVQKERSAEESSPKNVNASQVEKRVTIQESHQTYTADEDIQHVEYSSQSVRKETAQKKFNWYAFFFLFANAGYNRCFSILFEGLFFVLLVMFGVTSFENNSAYGFLMILSQILVSVVFGFCVKTSEKKSVVGLFIGMFFNFLCAAIFRILLTYGFSGFVYLIKSVING